jgi:aminoglycoside 6'-N-acetyltransferase I
MFLIRPATPADKTGWLAMRRALWPDATDLEDEIDHLFEQVAFQAWVAVDGQAIVGFAEASIRPFANGCDSAPVAFLEGIGVVESHRQQGVGRALVAAVEAWAQGQGIFELGSDTWLDDLHSQAVHQHWGFEETERVVYFRKKLGPVGRSET